VVTADLVIVNGKVVTVDREFSIKEAIAVKDGWIIDVGENAKIEEYIGAKTEVIDLRGKVILPGAHDAHLHAAHTGFFLDTEILNLKYPEVKSIKDINQKLKEAVSKKAPGEWIIGFGWNNLLIEECARENRMPNRWDFDEVTPDNPILLVDFSAHNIIVNSKALEICGIDRNISDLKPEEGRIDREQKNGELTGLFCEWGGMLLVWKHVSQLDEVELRKCIERVQKVLNQQGITSHADIVGIGGNYLFCGTWGQKVIEVYDKMALEGALTARVTINVMAGLNGVQSYDTIIEGLEQTTAPQFADRNWVKADIVKIFGDRVPGPENIIVFPGETEEERARELIKTIMEVHRRGWQMGVHSTGEASARAIVKGFIEAQRTYPREAPRHFLIHGDWLTREIAGEAAKYKIGLVAQPNAGYFIMDYLVQIYGEDLGGQLFRLQELANQGINVVGSSDANIFDPNWQLGVQFAVTRKTISGNVYRPDLASSLENAIRMYTINAAYQEHMENVKGSIEPNKLADFQVLEEDIFEVNKEEISQIPVVMTICNGKVVYSRL